MKAIEITKENFNSIIESNATVFLDFWAPWCGPCKMFKPIFEAAAEKHPDVVFGKVNTEDQQELAAAFGIRSIPTLMAVRDQIGVFQQPGALPAPALEQVITKVLELDMDEVRKSVEAEQKKSQPQEWPAPK